MKIKSTKLIPMAALVCLMAASCKKSESVKPSTQTAPEIINTANLVDLGLNEALSDFDDDDNSVTSNGSVTNSVVSGGKVSNSVEDACPVVTFSDGGAPHTSYPYTKTIDYGTGCEVAPGRTLSGKRIVEVKAKISTASDGTLISVVSYDGYKVNGLVVIGTRSISVSSGAGTDHLVLKADIKQSFRDALDAISSYVGTIFRTTIGGGDTKSDRSDDVFQITGSSYGAELHAENTAKAISLWKSVISDAAPVITQPYVCKERTAGLLNLTVYYVDETVVNASLNYGAGICDNTALFTISGEVPQSVALPFVFYNTRL